MPLYTEIKQHVHCINVPTLLFHSSTCFVHSLKDIQSKIQIQKIFLNDVIESSYRDRG